MNSGAVKEMDNLSKAWKERLELFEKSEAGESIWAYIKSDKFKQLESSEQRKLTLNYWGLLFGPFYYFFLGMWQKGVLFLAASWALVSILNGVEFILGVGLPSVFFWCVPAVLSALMVNHDYFQFKKAQKKIWNWVPSFISEPMGLVALPLATFLLAVLTAGVSVNSLECNAGGVVELVLDIYSEQIEGQFGSKFTDQVSLEVVGISQISGDSDQVICSGHLQMSGVDKQPKSLPIAYSAVITADGGIYVQTTK